MTVEFINNFCEKHGLEFQAYPNTIFIIRKARNEKLPGDLPTRNIEVFDIRLKENDWEIWSYVDGIKKNGTLIYLLVFGNEIDMDKVVENLEIRIKKLKEIYSMEKIKDDFN